MIVLEDVRKAYRHETGDVEVLKRISLSIGCGELVSIVGQSGSGKSTLMNILGMLAPPTNGRYLFDGMDVARLTPDQRAAFRNRSIGFVFQGFHLLPQMTALENVALPLHYRGTPEAEAQARAGEALTNVGLEARVRHKPGQLSGGQQQRVAIARAVVTRPQVILADEPTGALDSETGEQVLSLFLDLNKNDGITTVMITHNPDVAAQCPRQLVLSDGMIVSDNGGIRERDFIRSGAAACVSGAV